MATPISVIVPTYNQSTLLPETIDSLLSQRYPAAEIIVLDDGSSDNTRDVVQRMPGKVKYHYSENSGICKARKTGASYTSSPYIAFCDHDDLWREDKLEKQMELHDRHPDLQYSFTNFAIVTDGKWSQETKFDKLPDDFFSPFEHLESGLICTASLYEHILQAQPIFPSTTLMKRSFYDELGGGNERFGRNPAEDVEFTLRCVQHPPIGVVTEPVVGIRKHASNFSGDNHANNRGLIEIFQYALTHHTITDSNRAALKRQIEISQLDASYGAFARGQYDLCKEYLSAVPSSDLTLKLRMKLLVSSLPAPLASIMQRLVKRA